MKSYLLTVLLCLGALHATATTMTSEPPAGYPAVKGLVKRINIAANQITLKHEDIPNLGMPGMTMPFMVEDQTLLQGIQVGDQVKFSVKENDDGELVIIWLIKVEQVPASAADLVACKGAYGKGPRINIELEIRKKKYSTIRYEYADGPYRGTSYVNSIGEMLLRKQGDKYFFSSGNSEVSTKLMFEVKNNFEIKNAMFYKRSAEANFFPVECHFERIH